MYNALIIFATQLQGRVFPHWHFGVALLPFKRCHLSKHKRVLGLSPFRPNSINLIDFKLPYEAPIAESFTLSAAPMNICVQFSGDADFEDFEEGEAL